MQYFKGDALELKMDACGANILDDLSLQIDLFFEQCFEAYPLGDIISEDDRSPLSNAILPSIFRESYPEIFEAFTVAGTFESYLTVFRKIFGEDVTVTFTVPAAGKLEIDILAEGVVLSDFVARHITDNAYVFDTIIDENLDNIVFQTIKGFQSQYELEQMLFEMVPAGIYTIINLSLGE